MFSSERAGGEMLYKQNEPEEPKSEVEICWTCLINSMEVISETERKFKDSCKNVGLKSNELSKVQ